MTKYIIHIGPPKAGSKYIQSQLFHSRKFLEERGVLYPATWWTRPDKIMHDELRDHIRNGRDLKDDFEQLNSGRFEKIVLSCEGFDNLKLEHVERLRKFIGDNPVELVYYVRRWSDHIPSEWRQEVMMGQHMTFPEFYILLLNNPQASRVNASKIWDTYSKVFGREALRIVSFSNLVDSKIDLFKHFCKVIIGLPSAPEIPSGLIQHNSSPDMVDQETIRALNYLHYVKNLRNDKTVRIKFNKLRNKIDLGVLHEHMKSDMRRIKVDDNAQSLRATWNAFSAYQDLLVSPEYGKEIFQRRTREVDFVGQNYIFRPGVVDELMNLYAFISSSDVETPELRALQAAVT